MDYNKPETIVDALNQVHKVFLLTLPAPDMAIYSNLVKEIRKYGGINHVVKLSSMGAEPGLGTIIGRIHTEEEKSLKNLEYHLHSCVLVHLCKTL